MKNFTDRLSGLLDTFLACVLLAMVALACLNVALRYLWGISLIWADESLVFAMIGVTFLGVIGVSSRNEHLRMALLSNVLPRPVQWLVKLLEQLLTLALCLFVAQFAWQATGKLLARGTRSNMAEVPLWLMHGLILIGLLGMAVVALLRLLQATGLIKEEIR